MIPKALNVTSKKQPDATQDVLDVKKRSLGKEIKEEKGNK